MVGVPQTPTNLFNYVGFPELCHGWCIIRKLFTIDNSNKKFPPSNLASHVTSLSPPAHIRDLRTWIKRLGAKGINILIDRPHFVEFVVNFVSHVVIGPLAPPRPAFPNQSSGLRLDTRGPLSPGRGGTSGTVEARLSSRPRFWEGRGRGGLHEKVLSPASLRNIRVADSELDEVHPRGRAQPQTPKRGRLGAGRGRVVDPPATHRSLCLTLPAPGRSLDRKSTGATGEALGPTPEPTAAGPFP